MGCLEENTLAAFVESRLAPESLVEVEVHADQCTGCHDLLVAALNLSGLARTTVTERLRPTPGAPLPATERVGPARAARPVRPEAVAAGTSIGRFTVLGLVGRGGMGEVYAAYDPSLDRRVALKLMLPDGAASPEQGHARMMREAQAIAKLSHPNVVVVYEVGTFERRVFIAMEFIEGLTLAEWLTDGQRSWKEILEVYLQAARGLAAAHRAGLVHRDFKPQNVMVARDGSVRVTDFGLARRFGAARAEEGDLEPRASANCADAALTGTGEQLGTPLYMAPEQFASGRLDARTDQFSFCVALYWALFGVHPFGAIRPPELARAVRMAGSAARPRNAPLWLQRVIARGFATAASDRWPSMDDLAAALGRDPARRRRVVALAAAALVVWGVIGAASVRLVSHDRAMCSNGPARMAGVWELPSAVDTPGSRREAVHGAIATSGIKNATEIWERVSALLDGHATLWLGLYREACEATHVRREQSDEALDLRMACLADNLESTGALTQILSQGDPNVVERGVDAAVLLQDLDRCSNIQQLRSGVPLPKDPMIRAEVPDLRKRLKEAEALFELGDYERSSHAAEALLPSAERLGYCPLVAEILVILGDAFYTRRQDRGAPILEKALATGERCGEDRVVARAATELTFHNRLMDWHSAEQSALLAEAAIARIGGDRRLESWLANNIGALKWYQGHFEEARASFERAVDIKTSLLGPDSVDVGISRHNLAYTYARLGRAEEALKMIDEAQAVQRHSVKADSIILAEGLSDRAEILRRLGRLDEAERGFREALGPFDRMLALDDPDRAEPFAGLGLIAMARGRFAEAARFLETALHRQKRDTPYRIAETQFNLANALRRAGRAAGRSRELAQAALMTYEANPTYSREAKDVRTWLAKKAVWARLTPVSQR